MILFQQIVFGFETVKTAQPVRFVTAIFSETQLKKTCHKSDGYPVLAGTETRTAAKALVAKREGGNNMKIVVIGGTGLIGSKLVTKLNALGHEAVAAAPNTGVNTLTGKGLTEVLKVAQVVVDVSNSPSFEDAAVLDFFQTSTRNLPLI